METKLKIGDRIYYRGKITELHGITGEIQETLTISDEHWVRCQFFYNNGKPQGKPILMPESKVQVNKI